MHILFIDVKRLFITGVFFAQIIRLQKTCYILVFHIHTCDLPVGRELWLSLTKDVA